MTGEIVPVVPAELLGKDLIQRQKMLEPSYGAEQDPPQWVVMGILLHGRCAVLASSTLTRAEMRRRVVQYEKKLSFASRPARLEKDEAAVGFVCDGFTLIYGETYAECWRSLVTVWTPPELTS